MAPRILSRAKWHRFSDYDYDNDNDSDSDNDNDNDNDNDGATSIL